MQVALVIGSATSTVKDPSMQGQKLLVVQPLMADGKSIDGYPFVAVDEVGAGAGEKVIITSDGRATREFLKADKTPVRWSAIGIVDE